MSIFLVGDMGVWWAFGEEGWGSNKVNFAKRAKNLHEVEVSMYWGQDHVLSLLRSDIMLLCLLMTWLKEILVPTWQIAFKMLPVTESGGICLVYHNYCCVAFRQPFQLSEKVYYNFFYFGEFSRWNKFLQEAEMFICFQTRPFWTRTTYP